MEIQPMKYLAIYAASTVGFAAAMALHAYAETGHSHCPSLQAHLTSTSLANKMNKKEENGSNPRQQQQPAHHP